MPVSGICMMYDEQIFVSKKISNSKNLQNSTNLMPRLHCWCVNLGPRPLVLKRLHDTLHNLHNLHCSHLFSRKYSNLRPLNKCATTCRSSLLKGLYQPYRWLRYLQLERSVWPFHAYWISQGSADHINPVPPCARSQWYRGTERDSSALLQNLRRFQYGFKAISN